MRRLSLIALMHAAVFAVACSNNAGHVHVDLDRVVAQGSVTAVDGITSAGQPDAEAFGVFARSGYTTIIDMRMADEDRGLDEPTVVGQLGMDYVAFPVSSSDITLDKARELDALLGQYGGPVLVHCASGNRVGALLALREYLETGDREKALRKGKDAGLTRLESTVVDVIEGAERR